MSIVYHLVVALLCFPFHACNARSLGVIQKEQAEDFHNSISKKNEKLDQVGVSGQLDKTSASPDSSRSANIASKSDEERVYRESTSKDLERHILAKNDLVKVSWRVPHKKKGEPEPGFNLDYLPPKTHPPVHN